MQTYATSVTRQMTTVYDSLPVKEIANPVVKYTFWAEELLRYRASAFTGPQCCTTAPDRVFNVPLFN